MSIFRTELSAYDKFKNYITFKKGRYSINLLVKKYNLILPDNYSLILRQLQSLRRRL